jgi:hypothetical protein
VVQVEGAGQLNSSRDAICDEIDPGRDLAGVETCAEDLGQKASNTPVPTVPNAVCRQGARPGAGLLLPDVSTRAHEVRKVADVIPMRLVKDDLVRSEMRDLIKWEVRTHLASFLGKLDAERQLRDILRDKGLDDDSLD